MKYALSLALLFGALSVAHVNHEEESEHYLRFKREVQTNARRGLEKCSKTLAERGVYQRAAVRRRATVNRHRALQVRDTDTVLNTSHQSNRTVNASTPDDELFSQSSNCVLNPEGETGPFYVPGEYVRSNLRENQSGVPIVVEAQFIDVETCDPLTNVWWDLWNCNATGVYSGVVEQGNGNGNDQSNINATFLRGIQEADDDGVVTFESIFPGHYSGRATHHHMVAHVNATMLSNNTLSGGTVAHIGQVFWDQDLITKVEATEPYSTNDIAITENADDRVFSTETADTTSDPVFEYVYLGDDLSDGIFGWITIAVNTSATYDPGYSFVLGSDGGYAQSGGTDTVDGGAGGGGGTGTPGNGTMGGGNGTMPSMGAMPGNGTAMSTNGTFSATGSPTTTGTQTTTGAQSASASETSVDASTTTVASSFARRFAGVDWMLGIGWVFLGI